MGRRIRVEEREREMPPGDPGSVEVVRGLRFPSRGAVVEDFDHPSGLRVLVEVAPVDGRLVVDAVRVERGPSGAPVTLAALRGIALQAYVPQSLRLAYIGLNVRSEMPSETDAARRHAAGYVGPGGVLNVEDRDRLKAAGPSAETLDWVALIFRLAAATGEPPAKSVAGTFEVSPRTASNWIAAARAGGQLEPGRVA